MAEHLRQQTTVPLPDRGRFRDPSCSPVDSVRDARSGTAQAVVSRSRSAFDVASARYASGIDDAISTVDSLGSDCAYVIGGAGSDELFRPIVDRMVCSRVPGEYAGDTSSPAWDTDEWRLVERTPIDQFTLEEWKRAED